MPVLLIERDADAMESCGDYHDSVQSAVGRAAGLIAGAGQSQPPHEVRMTLTRLVAEDAYGTRRSLTAVMHKAAHDRSWRVGLPLSPAIVSLEGCGNRLADEHSIPALLWLKSLKGCTFPLTPLGLIVTTVVPRLSTNMLFSIY